jgi:hypothetical protein
MNNVIEFSSPAPSCLVPITHPARSHIPACSVDVAETWRQHSLTDGIGNIRDDYELTERSAHLDLMGEFPK